MTCFIYVKYVLLEYWHWYYANTFNIPKYRIYEYFAGNKWMVLFRFRYKFRLFFSNYRVIHKTISQLYVRPLANLICVGNWGWESQPEGNKKTLEVDRGRTRSLCLKNRLGEGHPAPISGFISLPFRCKELRIFYVVGWDLWRVTNPKRVQDWLIDS